MSIIASDSGSSFTPAPEGTWMAVCADVVDLGMVETMYGNKHKIRLVWQLEPEAGKTSEGKPLDARARFNLSLHEHSSLRPFLEAWRGKKFSAEELKGFDLEVLIGVCCQLQILHEVKGDKTYANVTAIMPYPRATAKMQVRDYIRVQDRELTPEDEPVDEYSNDPDLPF